MTHRHQLTCAQFVEMAEAFALGALHELEQRACARHITRSIHHHGCREALALAYGVMGRLAASLPPTAPPPELWSAIEARLGLGSGSSNAEWL
jgi:anti-sigma-K factor RskA